MGTPAFTIDTYQHVLPGMQAEAARTFEQLIKSNQTERPVEAYQKTVEAPVSNPLTGLSVAGRDLNPRPSGYEFDITHLRVIR